MNWIRNILPNDSKSPLSMSKHECDSIAHTQVSQHPEMFHSCVFPSIIYKDQCQYPKLNMRLHTRNKVLPSSYKSISPSCSRGCKTPAKLVRQLSPQQMAFPCTHPCPSGPVTGAVSPTAGDSRYDWRRIKSDGEWREPGGREKLEVKGLPALPWVRGLSHSCSQELQWAPWAIHRGDWSVRLVWKGQCGLLKSSSPSNYSWVAFQSIFRAVF